MSLTADPTGWEFAAEGTAERRLVFLDLAFDRLGLEETVAALLAVREREPFRYLVTPNVDHMLRISAAPDVAQLYRDAWLCINDSRVLSLLAAATGRTLPASPGSDLVAALLDHPDLDRSASILIVGGGEGLAEAVARRCGLTRLAQIRPPMGLRENPVALAETVAAIEAVGARFVFLAVGSPQQEMIAAALARGGRASGTGLCIGAGLEFLVGARRRAPAPIRAAGLEWLFRLACEPGRLGRRYLVDGPRIVRIFWDHARADRSRRKRAV